MGKLFGMTQSAYQRLESGLQHHQEATLTRIDEVLIANGFDWRSGLAAELDRGDIGTEILDRLERIESSVGALHDRFVRSDRDAVLIDRLRTLLRDGD